MFLHKVHHPASFRFADACADGVLACGARRHPLTIADHGGDCFRIRLGGGGWAPDASRAQPRPPADAGPSRRRIAVDGAGRLRLLDHDGAALLDAPAGGSFGFCGTAWLLEFAYDPEQRFYGCGEKWGAFEKTGVRTKFWNTDVWADFAWQKIEELQADPLYASIPWLMVRTPRGPWVGILIDQPYAPFLGAGGSVGGVAGQMDLKGSPRLWLGADDGAPDAWILVADSGLELVRRFQRLVGTTPLPPLWALGHQQCRFGYASPEDLAEVAFQSDHAGIPTSGLWLDIDYMQGFRVFTLDRALWGDDPAARVAALQADGRRVVPILDPGVKDEPGYAVRDSGDRAGAWCLTPEGIPYVGFVWPGETLFPDYASAAGAGWWAEQVAAFTALGFHGYWLDMNDPAVGPVELEPMRFAGGTLPHAAFHSQYGMAMAEATRAGMLAARPDERPFLLARSGWTGCQRSAALWTGDNLSTERHMAGSLATTLNLALSGVPMNGPDVPGFGHDAGEELALRWYQLGFLFPFLRNHCLVGRRAQEPWTLAEPQRRHVAHLIRLRQKLLPYLYQGWIAQERDGEPLLRPLVLAWDRIAGRPVDRIADQFLVGPDLLQAPLTTVSGGEREVLLPPGQWCDLRDGAWLDGDRAIRTDATWHTPLYVRRGAVVPMQPGLPRDHRIDLAVVELHAFLRDGDRTTAVYEADDGISFGYQLGVRSRLVLDLVAADGRLTVSVRERDDGYRPIRWRIVAYGGQGTAVVDGVPQALEPAPWNARIDRPLAVSATRWSEP
jgi:alpha-glucosidase